MADAASQPQEQQPQPVMKIMKRPAQPPSAWKAPPKLVSNVSVAIGCTTAESAVADTTGPKPRETAAGTPAAVSNDLLETATAQAVPTEGAAAAAAAAATALPPPPAQPQSTATGSSEATAHPISIAPEQPVVPKQPLVQGQHQPAMKIMRRPLLPTPPGRLMAPPLSGAGGPGAVATAPPFEGNVREEAVKLISQALMVRRVMCVRACVRIQRRSMRTATCLLSSLIFVYLHGLFLLPSSSGTKTLAIPCSIRLEPQDISCGRHLAKVSLRVDGKLPTIISAQNSGHFQHPAPC